MKIENIKIENIKPAPNQPRKYFDSDKLDELSKSIEEYGILQPIIVKEIGNEFEIIAGERRYRAAVIAGLSEVPVIVSEVDRYTQNRIAIIENIQRENLTSIEEAVAYKTLIDDYGLTQIEVSKVMGVKPSTISNKLRLLRLNQLVQDKIREGNLSERHGRALLKLDDEQQVKFMDKIITQDLTVIELERDVDTFLKVPKKVKKKESNAVKSVVSKDFKLALNTIKQATDLISKTGMKVDYEKEMDGDNLIVKLTIAKE